MVEFPQGLTREGENLELTCQAKGKPEYDKQTHTHTLIQSNVATGRKPYLLTDAHLYCMFLHIPVLRCAHYNEPMNFDATRQKVVSSYIKRECKHAAPTLTHER